MDIPCIFSDAIQQSATDNPVSWVLYPPYREHLADWDKNAGVRTRSINSTSLGSGTLPFLPELVPLTHHKLVCDCGEATQRLLLAQHFRGR
jgi:hypothetical protein